MGNEESVQAIQNDPNGTDFALNPNSFSRISTQKNSYQSTEKPFHLSNSNNLNSDTHHLNNKNYSSNNNNNNNNLLYGLNKNSNELDFHRQRSTQPTTTMLSSMTTNLIQKSAQQSGSMLNSTLGQLSSSFPNTMKPMNQLINQIQTSSFGSLGGGGGQQQQQKTSTSFGPAISNNAQQLRAQQMETSGGQQSTKIVPQATPPQVPEVDLSGLTEEEKQMIQSVMARAEQDTKNSIATSPASNPQQQQQQRAQKTSISSTVTTIPPSNHLKQTRPTSTIPSRMGVLSDDSIASSHHPQSSVVIRDQTNLMSSLGPQQPPSASSSSSLPNHPQQFEEMKSSAIHNDFQHPNSMQSNQQQFQMNRNQSNQSMQKSSQASINFQSHQPQQMLNAHNSLPCGVCNRQTNQMNLHNCNDCLKTFCDSCGDNAMSRLGPNNIKQCNLCIECSKRRQILSPNLVPPPPQSNILNSTTMKSHPSTGPQTMPSSSQSMPSRNSMMSFNNSNSIESNQFGPIIEDGYNQSSQSTNLFQSMDPTTSYLDQQSKQSSMIEANRVQQQLMGPQYSSSSIIVPVSNLNSNQYGPISSNSTETVYMNQYGNGQIQPQSSVIPNQNQIFPSNPMLQQQRQPIGMMGLVQQQPPQQSHQQDSVQSFGSIEQQQSQSQSQSQPQRQQQQQFDPFRTSQSMMMNQNQYQSNLKQNLQSHQQSTNLNQIKSQQQFNNTNTVNESNNVNSILNNQSSMISTLPSSSTAAASASTMMINDSGVYGGNMIESGDPLHFPPQQRLHQHQHQQQQQESIQSSMMKPQNVLGSNQLFYRPSYTMPSSLAPMKTTVVPRVILTKDDESIPNTLIRNDDDDDDDDDRKVDQKNDEDYGYLDFEIDEQYLNMGEESDDYDEDDDDEDVDDRDLDDRNGQSKFLAKKLPWSLQKKLYETNRNQLHDGSDTRTKHITIASTTTNNFNDSRISLFHLYHHHPHHHHHHHQFNSFRVMFPINTIPEEDEEFDNSSDNQSNHNQTKQSSMQHKFVHNKTKNKNYGTQNECDELLLDQTFDCNLESLHTSSVSSSSSSSSSPELSIKTESSKRKNLDGSNYSSSTSSMSIAPYNTNVETSMKKFNPQQHSTGPMSSQTSSMIMDGQQNFQPIIDQSSSNHTLNNMNQAIIDQRQQTINQTNSMNQNLGESSVINNQFVPIGQDDRRQSLSQAKASSSSVTMFSVSNRSPQANTIQSMEHHRSPQQQQQHHHHHHHLSVHQPSIRHQPDATWAHSMELSPIIDVSPSLEAAEANDSLDRRRNTLQSNADNLKTITGMIDDFNRTIKNLGLSDMKNTTLINSLDQSTPSTLSSDKKIGWDQSVSERDESRKILTRRASTGPTEGLDQYHSVKDQYHYKSWKPSSASSTITLSSSVASSIRPSTTLGSNRSNLMKKPSSLLTSISAATTTTTTAISIASNLNQEISNCMQSKSDTITLANSNQIEQHLQKQQQILIQQQQKLLQIQLEQQRLQNQIHEQQQKQHQQQQSSKSINDSTKETQRAMSGEQRRYPIESATNRLRKDGKTTVSTTSCGSTTSSLTQNHSKPLISVRALGPLDQSPSSSSSVYNQSNRQSRYRDTSTLITQHRKLPKPTGEDILSGDSRSKSIIQKSFLHQQKQQEKLGGKSYPETKRSTMNITNVSNIPQLVSSRTRSDGTVQEPRTSSTGTTTAMISPKKNTQFSTRQFLSQPQTNIVTKEKVRTLNYLDLDTKSMVSKNDNIRDGQSLKSANTRRRLPAAPAEEESISSLINTKRLIREKLGAPIKLTSNFRDDNRILFSSSYDSTIGLNKSGTKFSQMAATANRSRANTTNESMKIIKSKSDIVPGAYSVRNYLNDFSKTSDSSTSSFTDEIKTLQRKILNEFKTDDIFKRMKEGKNQSSSGDDHSNIKKIPFKTMVSNVNPTTTTTTTSSFSTAAIKNQFGSDSACLNLDDSLTRDHLKTMMMFKTNDGTNINTGTMPKSSEIGNRSSSTMIDRDRFNRFKSFEFENLNPTRLNEEKFCLTRPISSILFNQFGNSRLTSSPYNRTLVDQKNINSSNFNGESSFRYDDLLGTIQSKSFYPDSFKNDEKLRSLYRKYDLAIPNALRASNTNQSLDDQRLKSNYLFDKSLRRTNQSTNIRASPSLMFGLNSRRKNFWQSTNQSRSWHPSPFGSEVSDNERNDRNNNEIDDDDDDDDDNNENEDDIDISIDAARLHEAVLDDLIDRELSVEENMAKIRAEIRDRRQRLANSSDQFNRTFNEYLGDDVYNEYLDRNHPSFQIDPFGRRRRNSLNDYSYLDSEMKYFNSNPYLNENGNLQRSFNLYGSYDDEFVHPLRRQQFLQQQYRRLENQQQLDRRLNPSSALNYNSVPQLGPELAYPYDHSSIGLLNDYRSKMDHRMFTGDYGLQNSADALHHVQAAENQNFLRFSPKKTQFAPNSTRNPKYPFPIKRILLTQDPKIRSIDGTGIGLKVIGGKEIPGTNMIGAYIAKIHPSLSMNGEIQEGMQVIEWNGIPLTGISHDEVSKIISNQFGDEIEVVIRIDINLLSGQCGGHHYGETRTNMMMMPQQQQSTQFIRAPHHHQQQPLADTYAGSFDSYCVEQQRLGCGDPSANCCSNLIHNDSNYPTSSQPILGQPYQHQQQQHYHHPEQQQLQHQSLSSQQPQQQQQQQQIILHHNHPIVNETTTDSYANTRMAMPTQMKVQSTPYNNNSNNASINNNNGNNPHQNSFSMHHLHQAQPQQEQMMMMMMNAPQSNLPNHRSMMNNAINNGVNNHHLHNHNHYHLQQQSQRPQSPTSMMQQPNNIGAYY